LTKTNYLSHSKIGLLFRPNSDDFVVSEIPLYEFSGCGEHLMIQVRKKDLTTWQMLDIVANHLNIKTKDIGYAGLKDKNAMTIQYISCHKSNENRLSTFKHDKIKILNTYRHKNKLKIGHLKNNRFFIRLKQVKKSSSTILNEAIKTIATNGMANYFGYQRFGIDGDNHKKGEAILKEATKEPNKKLKKFYISAYQSYNFNMWLSKRVEVSKLIDEFNINELKNILNIDTNKLQNIKKQTQPFKLLLGDVLSHYPYGRLFLCEDINTESSRFQQKLISPTGILIGQKTTQATNEAGVYEKMFCDFDYKLNGSRRYAWVYPTDITSNYIEDKKHLELEFSLPKGSYATEFVWHICG